jgi:hypothetical protein
MLQRDAPPLAIAVLSAFPVALAQPMIAQVAITVKFFNGAGCE